MTERGPTRYGSYTPSSFAGGSYSTESYRSKGYGTGDQSTYAPSAPASIPASTYRHGANELRGADIIAEYLIKEKVPYILGYAGHGAIGLLDGIFSRTDRIRHISPRIEQSAAGPLSERLTDGIVPTLSMLNGRLLWCGMADHLDVVGHFRDDHRPARHTDWLASGAQFNRAGFKEAMDAIARFILEDTGG